MTKKFLAISKKVELLPALKKVYTTETSIARKINEYGEMEAECLMECGYTDVSEDTFAYLTMVAKRICFFCGEKLNEYHRVTFAEKEWELLIFRDVLALVQAIYERYNKVRTLKADEFYTYGVEAISIAPPGVWNGGIVREDDYNTFIYSVICKELGVEIQYKRLSKEKVKKEYETLSRIKKAVRNPKVIYKWIKRKIIHVDTKKSPDKLRINDCKSLLVRTRMNREIENKIIQGHPDKVQRLEVERLWQRTVEIAGKYQPDLELRGRMLCAEAEMIEDRFERICLQIIPYSISLSAVEAFEEINTEAKKIVEHARVEKIYTSGCMFIVCFLENLCGVYLRRRGAKVYHIQHAAAEGISEFELNQVKAIGFDAMLTWGWERHTEGFEYLPRCITRAPELQGRDKISNAKENNRILIVAPVMEEYNNGYFDNSQIYRKYFEFLDSLDFHLYSNVVVRVRDSLDSDFCQKHKKYAGVKLETMKEMTFEESIRKSALVVSTYYSSCHVETMCADIPCVMFECVNCCGINPTLQGVMKNLVEAHILFEDGRKAANFVSSINDYAAWWGDEEVKKKRAEYLKPVVGDYRNLHKIWLEEFLS